MKSLRNSFLHGRADLFSWRNRKKQEETWRKEWKDDGVCGLDLWEMTLHLSATFPSEVPASTSLPGWTHLDWGPDRDRSPGFPAQGVGTLSESHSIRTTVSECLHGQIRARRHGLSVDTEANVWTRLITGLAPSEGTAQMIPQCFFTLPWQPHQIWQNCALLKITWAQVKALRNNRTQTRV